MAVIEEEAALGAYLVRLLEQARFRVIAAPDGETGLRTVREHQPDLVVLHLTRSSLSSTVFCRVLRRHSRLGEIPVLALTPPRSTAEMLSLIEAGATDLIAQPVRPAEFLARVEATLRARALHRRREEAQQIVASLANAVEAKDPSIDGHCRRLAYRAARLGAYVGLRGAELEAIAFGAILHDIGKIAISEALLDKAGPLNPTELERMREHPAIGGRICEPLRSAEDYVPIIRHHHERWDGLGYPQGLRGERIPLGARIVAIADAYDAITFGRPYRQARSHEEAMEELTRCAGSQFDPALVPLFIHETERLDSGLPPAAELPLGSLIEGHLPVASRAAQAA